MRKHIFNAGPSILNLDVLMEASNAVLELDELGMSVLEISHRSPEFAHIMNGAQDMIRQLMGLDDSYHVLFLQGGASMQFCMLPYNLLDSKGSAFYFDTGKWANNAVKEAKHFGTVNSVSSEDKNYCYIPERYSLQGNEAYLHYTSNNTIYGTQVHKIPEVGVPLICDMSSDIFSREMDFSRFDLIYAGAQKNLGPAGVTIVILKDSLLGKVDRQIPTMLDYKTHISKNSLFNTPPVFAIYVCYLTLKRLIEKGGLEDVEKANDQKAATLYNEIDENPLFVGTANQEDRSKMNVTFKLEDDSLNELFLNMANEVGLAGLKGHRSVGGFRASIYNALPLESVNVLVETMREFATVNG